MYLIETEIKEVTVPKLAYDGVTTWKDIEITGTVIEKGTENVVDGIFTITNKNAASVLQAETYNDVIVTFTPYDTGKYLRCETTLSITVNKATPAWKDGNIPTITIDYGSKFGGTIDELAQYFTGSGSQELSAYLVDENGELMYDVKYEAGKYPLKVRVITKSTLNKN